MVYVLDCTGMPLMPTNRHGKVRRMLKNGEAKIIKREPFTIQILKETTHTTQPITIGLVPSATQAGISATSERQEFYNCRYFLRTDISYKLNLRRQIRNARRGRKTRYRKCRKQNRRLSKWWVAPSIYARVKAIVDEIKLITEILPVTEIHLPFEYDPAMLKRPIAFDRQYVLARDGHRCLICGSTENLEVHHFESRLRGNDNPANCGTLCHDCHHKYHAGNLDITDAVKSIEAKETRESIAGKSMDFVLWIWLKKLYREKCIPYQKNYQHTTLRNDARRLTGHAQAAPAAIKTIKRKVRCHNRQTHAMRPSEGGERIRYQTPYIVNGFRVNDRVQVDGRDYFVRCRKQNGCLILEDLYGRRLEVHLSRVKFKAPAKHVLTVSIGDNL